jgi:hypothetical protein
MKANSMFRPARILPQPTTACHVHRLGAMAVGHDVGLNLGQYPILLKMSYITVG